MSFSLESLPIFASLKDVHVFISQNPYGAIIGPTGIGKSLGIPAYIANILPEMKIYIGVPSINLARNLKFNQVQMSPQLRIAYAAVDFPPDPNSQIIYATYEYIKNFFINNIENGEPKPINNMSILFIDESHLTSFDNFVIINLYKFFREKNVKHPRLYLLSTTINEDLYPDFPLKLQLHLTIKSKKIDIIYSNVKYEIDNRDTHRKYIEMLNRLILHHQGLPTLRDTFIVYVPGKGDVNRVMDMLKNVLIDRKITDIDILASHSGLSSEKILKIYQPTPGRKVIISTKAFSSGVTIPLVGAVFDTMLEKRPTNEETFRLITTFVSRASATQRAGRTGRDIPGVCFRMCTKEQYETFDEFESFEIEIVPLYRILLKLISINLSPLEILPPKKYHMSDRIRRSIQTMLDLTIINQERLISDLGFFYLDLDLLIKPTCILWWWLKSNTANQYVGLVIALLINNYQEGYFEFDRDELKTISLDDYKSKYFNKFRGDSDLHTYMNVWLEVFPLLTERIINDFDILRDWADNNRVNGKKLSFFYKNLKALMIKLNQKGFNIVPLPYNTNEIINQITPILRKIYSNKEFTLVRGKYVRGEDRYILDRSNQVNNYEIISPPKLLSFYEIGVNKINKITFSVNIDINDKRMFTLDVISSNNLTYIIPKRAHKPEFISKTQFVHVKYPPIDYNTLKLSMNLEPEIPEQNIIKIEKKFPYIQ